MHGQSAYVCACGACVCIMSAFVRRMLCVRVCVCACVCACVHACMLACVRADVCASVCSKEAHIYNILAEPVRPEITSPNAASK